MNRQEAAAFLGFMVGRIGGGYHPDNSLDEYIDRNHKPCFTPQEIAQLQPLHDEMMDVLGNDSYSLGLELFSKALNL